MNYKQRKVRKKTLDVITKHSEELIKKYPEVVGESLIIDGITLYSLNDCEQSEQFLNECKTYRQYRIEARKILKERGII